MNEYNSYLIPANAKKSMLIFSVFRPFDLMLFGGGCVTSLISLALCGTAELWVVIICILPAAITGLLVVPIPNYHNVLVALQSVYRFYNTRRKYIWRGWCANEWAKNK